MDIYFFGRQLVIVDLVYAKEMRPVRESCQKVFSIDFFCKFTS